MKQTGHTGYGVNDKKELKILNRTNKIDVLTDEMTLEADTKLVENALERMKLKGATGVDSPRVRRTEEQTAQIENSEKLTSAESTLYRSLVMKLAYIAQDRVDIAEAVKCLTRHMPPQDRPPPSRTTPAASGPPGLHTTTRELQTCTFQGPGASNTTKIPRKDPQERERRMKIVAGEGKQSAKFWASHPSGPHPSGPTFSRFGPPPFGATTIRGLHP